MKVLISILVGVVSFPIFDYLFIGNVMKDFYLDKMGYHLNIKDGSVSPNILFAVLTYIVMALLAYLFVVRGAIDWKSAAITGALFGFLIYSFYDLTNIATMRNYPIILGVVDIVWGTVLVSIVSVIMFFVAN
jgi:uncharacterized membrane protein